MPTRANGKPPTGAAHPTAAVDSSKACPSYPFPIVGIGASAGGLDAFTQVLTQLPADSGMAFVLIQHLDPTHKSFLGESLRRTTALPVTQVVDGEHAQPNHVYFIPPDSDISIDKGVLTLVARAGAKPGLHLPINFFFTALAAACGSQAIGVILSGTASDGTEGLRAIKAEGGITIAQDPRSAKFPGMPSSAIEAGVVDHVLTIPHLIQELVRLSRHPYLTAAAQSRLAASPDDDTSAPAAPDPTVMAQIKAIVKTVVGVDFGEYKAPTFERRLARRMALRKIDGKDKYLALLQTDQAEVRALYEETLIHVSSFFRDPEVFDALKETVFPGILKEKAAGEAIRIWVAGCATGEEVYSLALSLLEFLGDSSQPHPLQIFGSDVSEQAIQTARAGRYAESAMRGISDERRRRYFSKIEGGYLINKTVRDLCVFVRHDLASDPPFSKVDLLSCRNVLIYFDQPLQKRLLPLFHYSLNLPGFLLLGRAEDISGFSQLFSCVDKARKIFVRSAARSAVRSLPRGGTVFANFQLAGTKPTESPRAASDVGRHLDDLLLRRYAPPGVLVNDRLEIMQFRGQTGAFLQPAPGEPQNNIVKMARGGLLSKLRTTLSRAKETMAPVRAAGVEVDQDGFTRICDVVVLPFTGMPHVKEPLFVVLFEEPSKGKGTGKSRPAARLKRSHPKDAERIPQLEHELSATTDYLHSLIEEHSRTNDDLGSANEELVSGNEELQSLNEELETAKEELQSTNEELTTVNDELHTRNQEVSQINSDLANLLDTVDVPIVILDKQRHIRRFTPQARNVLNIAPTDVGRLFDELKPKINVTNLDEQVSEVIATFVAKESEVQDRGGRWYRMQIRPYKTADNNIDGAIVSLLDINSLKHTLTDAQKTIKEAERADRAKDGFLAVLSHELRTPLAALLMQVQFLKQVGEDRVKRDRACAAIERSAKRQAQLIDDLLDVSRIVTGTLRVDLQPTDLRAVVETALEVVAANAATKSTTIHASLGSSTLSVSGDHARLEQVVANLLNNAIKFTPKGGRVDVTLEEAGGRVHLTISDNGDGIEAGFLPRVFDRLTQQDSSSTRTNSGMGLGLAIVRHLVRAHGGSVTAESPGPGRGSTFRVILPLIAAAVAGVEVASQKVDQPSAAQPAVVAAAGQLAGRRILVLEDDTSIGEALAAMLTQSGASVQRAESVSEGMTVFEAFRPEVMLCDIAMPGEDGCAFIQKIRALASSSGGDTPALALTGLAGESDRQRALAEGFQSYLVKPVDLGYLVEATASLLKPSQRLAAGERQVEGSVVS